MKNSEPKSQSNEPADTQTQGLFAMSCDQVRHLLTNTEFAEQTPASYRQ